MSLPTVDEFAALHDLAFEFREVFAERGHSIGRALDLDVSFREGEDPRSTLARALAKDAARIAASRIGMSFMRGSGGARSVQSFDDNVDRWYRIRMAKKVLDNSYVIEANSDAILRVEGDSLFKEERWVLAYTLDSSNQIDDLFVAEVLDVVEGAPGYLELGPIHHLGAGEVSPPTGRFNPTEEDLEGFDDDTETGTDSDVG